MYIFHSTVRVNEKHRDTFEAGVMPGEHEILSQPGFVRRLLLKDKESPVQYSTFRCGRASKRFQRIARRRAWRR